MAMKVFVLSTNKRISTELIDMLSKTIEKSFAIIGRECNLMKLQDIVFAKDYEILSHECALRDCDVKVPKDMKFRLTALSTNKLNAYISTDMLNDALDSTDGLVKLDEVIEWMCRTAHEMVVNPTVVSASTLHAWRGIAAGERTKHESNNKRSAVKEINRGDKGFCEHK